MAGPDIRILVGAEGGASASKGSAALIRSELSTALKDGIAVKVRIDQKSLDSIKSQINALGKGDFHSPAPGSSKSSGATPTASSRPVSELTKARIANANAMAQENLESQRQINIAKIAAEQSKKEAQELKTATAASRESAAASKAQAQELKTAAAIRRENIAVAKAQAQAEKQASAAILSSAKVTAQATSGLANFNEYVRTISPSTLSDFLPQVEAIREGYSSVMSLPPELAKQALDKTNIAVKTLRGSFKSLGAEGGNIFTYLHSKIKAFATYLISSAITMKVVTGIRDSIQAVRDLNGALTSLRIVTNGSLKSTQELLSTYNSLARELGSTTAIVSKSANDWLRQGYSIADTNTLIKDSMMLSIVGEMDSVEATEALTAAMKGYGLSVDQVIGVIDKFTGVDIKAATSSSALAIALSKTAANAKLAGLSLDDVIGQLAIVNETMKESGEETGTFYNTMLSRMGAIKSGNLVDPESAESLSDVETTLNRLDIKLRDTKDQFRNFGDVLNDVGAMWNSLNSVDQRAVAQSFAGTRQQTRFISLMSGWDKAQNYSEVAAESAGTAMEKFGKYEEGLEAKTNRMTAAFEKMANSILPSGLIGGLLDIGTATLTVMSAFGGVPAQIALVTTAILVLTSAISALSVSTFGASLQKTFSSITSIYPTLQAVGSAVTLISAAQSGAAISTDALAGAFSLLTSAKIVDLAVTGQLEVATFKAAIASSTLSDETKKEILNLYASAAAATADATAKKSATAATGGLKFAMVGLGDVIKAHPLIAVISLLAVAIPAGIALFKKFNKTTEELTDEFSETTDKLSAVNDELSTTITRINELQGKGPISLVEQDELDRLKLQNQYLEARKAILEEQQWHEAKAINDRVVEDYEEDFKAGRTYINRGGGVTVYDAEEDILLEKLERYFELSMQKGEYGSMSSEEQNAFDTELQKTEEYLRSVRLEYLTLVDTLQDVNGDYGEHADIAEHLISILSLLNNALNGFLLADLAPENIDEIATKLSALKNSMERDFQDGNVKLSVRPEIEVDGSYATVLSSLFTDEEYTNNGEATMAIHLTPILDDGTMLSDNELDSYFKELLSKGSREDILEYDESSGKGIVLAVHPKFKADQSTSDFISLESTWAENLHKAQEEYYDFIRALRDDESFGALFDAAIEEGLAKDKSAASIDKIISSFIDTESAADGAAEGVFNLGDALKSIESSRGVLDAVLTDIDGSGKLSLGTLQKIAEAYPELEDKVGLYSVGLISVSDLLSEIQKKYDEDLRNYSALMVAKNQYNEKFYASMLKANEVWVSEFAKKYGVDLKNYKDLATAKLAIEQELLGKVTGAWGQFYNAQTNSLTDAAENAAMSASKHWNKQTQAWEWGPKSVQDKDILATISTIQEYVRALDEIDKISIDFSMESFNSAISLGDKSKTAAKEVEAYVAQIDALRDALRRLEDVQNEIATKEAKLDLVDAGDVEKQEQLLNDLIGSYKTEQAELHNLNNARDTLISSISDQLRESGFSVNYDPDSNNFWINNLEHLNELGASLSSEDRNELIKQYEELIEQAEEYNEENIEGSLEWLQIQAQILDNEKQITDIKLDALKDQKEHLDDLVEITKDLIKQEKEDMVDALEEQTSKLKEIIDLKKKSLEITEKERSYQDDVNEKKSKIDELQSRIDVLGLDGTREAQAEQGKLLEEMAKLQKDLADTQHDYYVDNAQDALDKELTTFESTQDKKISEIKKFLDDNQALTKAAMDRIDQQGNGLFDDLLGYALRYTNTTEAELVKMWDSAKSAVAEYGSAVQAVNSINSQIDIAENGSNASSVSIKAAVAEMKANSAKWHSASPDEQDRLLARNKELGEAEGIGATIDNNGVWWLGGKRLYDVYHEGTPSAGRLPTPKQNELWALIEKGESLITERQQSGLLNMFSGAQAKLNLSNNVPSALSALAARASGSPDREITVNAPITINGYADDQILSVLEKHPRVIAENVSNVLRSYS